MHPSKKQKKFGENRLTFFSEVPNLSRGDVQSVEAKKEKKVEEKLDAEGNVVRKGREAATWSVDDLVSKSNVTIAKHRTALAELPQGFNDRLRSAISQYIKNSPQNFDKDEYRGLGNTEYRRFSDAMHSKVRSLVEQYAPTQSEINEKKEAQRKMKEAKKAAKEIQQVSLKDIQDDPGDIEDLPTLSKKYEAYESWNESLQDQAGKVMAGMGKFQARFQEFQQARSGLQAYKKFANFFSGDDAEMIALKSLKAKHEATTKATIEKIRAAQKKLDSYGKEMAKASNEQKEEKMEERDERLRQIEENASLSKKEKKVRKAQFEKVKGDKEVLTTQRDQLQQYKDQVLTTEKENIQEKTMYAQERQGQVNTYGTILRASMAELDRMMEDPNIPDRYWQALQTTRSQFAEKEAAIALAEVGIEATISDNYDKFNALSQAEQTLAEQTYKIDTHITEDIDPNIEGLDGQISILDNAMLQFTDSKEFVMKHYDKVFKTFDNVDAAIDNAVLSHSLANEKLIGSLESQQKALGKMRIESPSGFTGFFESTLGAGLSTVGAGITGGGEWLIDQAVHLDEELKSAKENGMNPALYWISKVGTEVISAPIGVAGGLVEMGGGLVNMVAKPGEALNGMGALIGRNPATGEWFDGNTSETWKQMGAAMIQWEHFSNGRIGVGIGKIFPDIVLTLTGAGAVAKGGKAAKLAYQAAKEAGESTMQAIRIASAQAGQVAGTELLTSGKEAIGTIRKAPGAVLKGAKQMPGALRKTPGAISGAARATPDIIRRTGEVLRKTPSGALKRGKEVLGEIRDLAASESKLGERIFGEDAVKRGLRNGEKRLLRKLEGGADDLAEFKKLENGIREKFPELSDSEVRLKIMKENYQLYEKVVELEKRIDEVKAVRSKFESEYHLETDALSGMTQKQMLYTPEGMQHLAEKFGDEVSVTFADVTGMGMGNKYLHAVGETIEDAKNTVDFTFKLMKEVADEVFQGKPYEMVRFGGDEIVFLTKQGDRVLMDQFFKRFKERKKDYLEAKIGRDQYDKAKLETNIKAQQKKISLDPGFKDAFDEGVDSLRQWFATQLSADEILAHPDLADQFRLLAEKRLPPKSEWLEPLDFYRAPESRIKLQDRSLDAIREDLMDSVALGDKMVTELKAGKTPIPEHVPRTELKESAAKYLNEAKEVSEFAVKLKGLQDELALAEGLGNKAKVAELQREITTIRTRDPGTGVIRLNLGRDYALEDLIPLPEGASGVHVMQMDIPYFGVYNARYEYVGADEIVKILADELTAAYGGKVNLVRDGGSLFAISEGAPPILDMPALQSRLTRQLEEYAFPMHKDKLDERARGMARQAAVKKASTGATDRFGEVALHEPRQISIETGTTLWDTLNTSPGKKVTPRYQTPDGMRELYLEYEKSKGFIRARNHMKGASEADIARVLMEENPELHSKIQYLKEGDPQLFEKMKAQDEAIIRINNLNKEEGLEVAMSDVLDGTAPLTKELVEEILSNNLLTASLRKVLDENPQIILDWRLGTKKSLLNRVREAHRLHEDVRYIASQYLNLKGEEGVRMLEGGLARVMEGKPLPPSDRFGKTLERLKARDPEAFELLKNTESRIVIESDCLEAIISGNKIEEMGQNGPVSIYVGKRHLGKGTFGNVDLALYTKKGEKGFTRAAYKRANDTDAARIGFAQEIDDAKLVQTWDHPNIIKILDVGEDWILSDTGSAATNLLDGIGSLKPEELFGLYDSVLDGMEAIWQEGYFHGDLKPQNILSFMENGKRVAKIIDHTPNRLGQLIARYGTEAYCFMGNEIVDSYHALMELGRRGLSNHDIEVWISRAQDTKAAAKSITNGLDNIIDRKHINQRLPNLLPEQVKLVEKAKDISDKAEDIIKAGDPEFLLEVRALAKELADEFSKAAKDPSRPQLAVFGPGSAQRTPEAFAATEAATSSSPTIASPPPMRNVAPPPPPAQ